MELPASAECPEFATRCLKPRAERRASEAVKSGAAKRGCGVASRSQAPKAAWMLILESSHRKPGPQGYTLLEDTSRSTQLMLGLPAWSSHFLTEPRKQGRVACHSARRMNKICAMHRAQALAECHMGNFVRQRHRPDSCDGLAHGPWPRSYLKLRRKNQTLRSWRLRPQAGSLEVWQKDLQTIVEAYLPRTSCSRCRRSQTCFPCTETDEACCRLFGGNRHPPLDPLAIQSKCRCLIQIGRLGIVRPAAQLKRSR